MIDDGSGWCGGWYGYGCSDVLPEGTNNKQQLISRLHPSSSSKLIKTNWLRHGEVKTCKYCSSEFST